MARKPARNCTRAGCAGVIRGDVCTGCGPVGRDRRREYDRKRTGSRYADRRWRKVRQMQLNNDPLCEDCLLYGKTVTATDVHHVIPKRDGGSDAFENLRSLCHSCHSKITARGG